MKLRLCVFAAVAILAGCRSPSARVSSLGSADRDLLRRDVEFLASDVLQGRATGTPGNDTARVFIARRFEQLGLEKIVTDSSCRCPSYAQAFVARPAASAHAASASLPTGNVVGFIPGRDPALRGQLVVVGAHLDHLGTFTAGALDPEKGAAIRNGADDNASGVAAVMELARLLSRRAPARSIAVVAFSGEEIGLLGSAHFVDHPPFALDSVVAMLNFDMVGRLRDDKLLVFGAASATEFQRILADANTAPPFALTALGDGVGPSDHASFYLRDLPVLHFFTDSHDDYHRASDDAEKINAEGLARVVNYAERIVRVVADRPTRLTFVRAPVTAARTGSAARTGPQVYLGSVPDMAAGDVKGLRLTGVRPGSPAEQGGLKAGDIILELAGRPVSDLQSYSDALYSHRPGDQIEIVAMRGTERITVRVTLAARS
jgi:aminopeptidase YwaD